MKLMTTSRCVVLRTIGWTPLKCGTNIHVPIGVNCNNLSFTIWNQTGEKFPSGTSKMSFFKNNIWTNSLHSFFPQVECTMTRSTQACATSMSGGSASHWPRRKASTIATSWAATAGWVETSNVRPARTRKMREEEAGGGSREGGART